MLNKTSAIKKQKNATIFIFYNTNKLINQPIKQNNAPPNKHRSSLVLVSKILIMFSTNRTNAIKKQIKATKFMFIS